VRDQLSTILTEVTDKWNAKAGDVNASAKQKIIAAGTTIRTLDSAQRDAWKAAMKPVWAKFSDQIGQDVIDAALAANQGS
jgi:C4-dicarboxylate-binding protein DctP